MKWDEFLVKLKEAKAKKAKLGFNANALTRLIFAGSFNSMIKEMPEYATAPAWERCHRMTREAMEAIKSDAKLPKKSKTEAIGVVDIKSDTALVLWRHLVNPLFTYNLSGLYPEHMRLAFGFTPNKRGDTKKIPMVKEPSEPGKAGSDLLAAFIYAFESPNSSYAYQKGTRWATCMGIITKTESRRYGAGKKCLDVTFFDGYHEYQLTLWPPFGNNDYNLATAAELKPCAFGLFVIKPSVYKGKKGGSLVKFYDMKV